MTGGSAAWANVGDADRGKTLRAAAADLAVSAVVALLLWPFPLIRLTLGVPWAVHVPLIAAWILLVYATYLAISALIWRRSVGMYLLDLGLAGRGAPFPVAAGVLWACGWALALFPAVLGARRLGDPREGLPARLSGLVTVAASDPRRDSRPD